MFSLTGYQRRVLNELKDYLILTTKVGAADAFTSLTQRTCINIRQLPGLPYVCLRVPTGGGKTVIACNSINIIAKELLHQDNWTVLWLVPTTQIKNQTLKALRDINHPYRMTLQSTIQGEINVFDLKEALYIPKSKYDNATNILVSTIAALRVEDTDGRKIYDQNGYLMTHFQNLSETQINILEKNSEGQEIYSLANMLTLRRPIVIMDEAHNARTNLSFDTLARFNPSCVVELTATPENRYDPSNGHYASNVLSIVSAAELKAEGMIKLPIYLKTQTNWKEIVQFALHKRKQLEEAAINEKTITNEYIRPIILFQAQPKSSIRETLTVEVIKKTLIEDFKISQKHIAIATGETNELEDVDLLDKNCDIRFIITVQALKEGWDCPFAYVLCSVADINSSRTVEQIVGRILRLPKATLKNNKELNNAYAYVASSEFQKTLQALGEGLIDNGFDKLEIDQYIKSDTNVSIDDIVGEIAVTIDEKPKLDKLETPLQNKITYNNETKQFIYHGLMNEEEKDKIKECFSGESSKSIVEEMFQDIYSKFGSISTFNKDNEEAPFEEKKSDFHVPYLAVLKGEQLQIFEQTHFINVMWDLSKYDARLDVEDIIPKGNSTIIGEITVSDEGKLQTKFIQDLYKQTSFLVNDKPWTIPQLIYWLDRNIQHQDIAQPNFIKFASMLIENLVKNQNLELDKIIYYKFNLREQLTKLINKYRDLAHKEAYNLCLLEVNTKVNYNFSFKFNPDAYPASWYYNGPVQFQKHYYKSVGELKSDGEEHDCACYLDLLPEVKYWVRNIERKENNSFWLQTSTDKFYPDFVCLLNDGRILVVEYKGKHLITNDDSKEKKALGEFWAEKSNGKCLFAMVSKENISDLNKMLSS